MRTKRRPRGQMPLFRDMSSGVKPERLRARRRRARLITTGVLAASALVGVWVVGLLSYNTRVTIADVHVSGAKEVSSQNIERAFDAALHDGTHPLFSRANIFLYPRKSIVSDLLQKFPRLESVSIERTSLLSQAVVVTVEEREVQYEWCDTEKCYLMDGDGFIFAQSFGGTGEYVFRGGLFPGENPIGQVFLRGRLSDITRFLNELGRAGFTPRGATVENEKDLTVELAKGFSLKVSFRADLITTLKNFELAAVSEALTGRLEGLEYIDLRFGNRLYYKFRGAEEVSSE